jgi:predicted ATPase/class 3 adenylate cyclase/DNA-binding CsgD family transcriptional regulator
MSPELPTLPTGVVTFLMTDVESSTALWRDSPHAAAAMARQAELIGDAIAKHGGARPVDQGEGDSALAAFARPGDALAAACDAQRGLAAESWPEGAAIRVRMAVHTGEAELRDERNYGGLALIRCARLRGLANGGQVLVSDATAALAGERLPEGAALLELETVTLAGFERPQRVHQLCHPELPPGAVGLRRSAATALPAWPTALVGRAHERCDVADRLAESRLVTLTGAGGSGKTRLAHAVAEDLQARFRDGVAWVELARLGAPEQVAGAVVAASGAREVPGVSALEVLVRHLASAELLLVLDNCEHLLGPSAELAEALLRACPGVRLLTTSREPLGVEGEASWRVPSLGLPEPEERDAASIAASDAVSLFVARARAAHADFRLDAESAPLVARICRRLDGIPLALELAAARVRALSLQRLADGLDDRFRLLTGGARTAMARQRTLHASVEWSHDLLDEEERTLFRRLAVFGAPFTLEAAEAVAAGEDLDALSVFDLLAHLVDKSLVLHAGDRYRLLETIRQYALERADDAGELAELRERHLAWFERRARGWRLGSELPTDAVLAELAAEAPDLIAAAEWSVGRDRRLPAGIAVTLAAHWGVPEAFEEARRVGTRLLGALEPGSQAWLEGLAPLAFVLVLSGEVGWMEPARAALAQGELVDPVTRAFLERGLWLASAARGDAEGLAALRRSAEVGQRAGMVGLETLAKLDLANLFAASGDVAAARPLLDWIERRAPQGGWLREFIEVTRAWADGYQGELAPARRIVEHSPARVKQLLTLYLAAAAGLWTRDAGLLRRGLSGSERFGGLGAFEGVRDLLTAYLRLLEEDLEGAAAVLEKAPEGWGAFGSQDDVLRAEVAFSRGDVAGAAAQLDALAPQLAARELPYVRCRSALLAAHLARARGDRLAMESHAHGALELAEARGITLSVIDALELHALAAGDRGAHDEAARFLGAADAARERTGYRWQPLHQRRALDELRPKLVEPALAEGAALSLAEAAAYASRGRGERGRPDHGWESLTPSELRVVELVAEGLPNAAIAKKLFVSLATVKTHLVHVYGKLGLETRAQLAAAATRRQISSAGGSS